MLSFYGCIPDIKLEIKNIPRFLEKSSICLRKFCLDVLGIIVVVVTLKTVCWEAIFRYFWAYFWERSSISWKLFNISWNFAKMFLVLLWKSSHKKTFPWHVLLHWESVWGIFWPVLVYTFLFVEICSIFLLKILHRYS